MASPADGKARGDASEASENPGDVPSGDREDPRGGAREAHGAGPTASPPSGPGKRPEEGDRAARADSVPPTIRGAVPGAASPSPSGHDAPSARPGSERPLVDDGSLTPRGQVADDDDEKRGNLRAAIALRVDYRRLNTFFADYTKNISRGGTFIGTPKPLSVGTEFVFILGLPAREEHLELLGQVMWTVSEENASADNPAGMGIKFKFKDEEERREVARFVERLMDDALGTVLSKKLRGGG